MSISINSYESKRRGEINFTVGISSWADADKREGLRRRVNYRTATFITTLCRTTFDETIRLNMVPFNGFRNGGLGKRRPATTPRIWTRTVEFRNVIDFYRVRFQKSLLATIFAMLPFVKYRYFRYKPVNRNGDLSWLYTHAARRRRIE